MSISFFQKGRKGRKGQKGLRACEKIVAQASCLHNLAQNIAEEQARMPALQVPFPFFRKL
jgi:hypothetical protein